MTILVTFYYFFILFLLKSIKYIHKHAQSNILYQSPNQCIKVPENHSKSPLYCRSVCNNRTNVNHPKLSILRNDRHFRRGHKLKKWSVVSTNLITNYKNSFHNQALSGICLRCYHYHSQFYLSLSPFSDQLTHQF
jgi:hypothetical protein